MDEERRHSPGRRDRDRILDAIWRELDDLKDNLRRELDRLERDLEQLEEKLLGKVHGLETFHIEEATEDRLRFATRARGMEKWSKWSIAIGALGTLAGIAGFLLAVSH